jgi:hypothetical protein
MPCSNSHAAVHSRPPRRNEVQLCTVASGFESRSGTPPKVPLANFPMKSCLYAGRSTTRVQSISPASPAYQSVAAFFIWPTNAHQLPWP